MQSYKNVPNEENLGKNELIKIASNKTSSGSNIQLMSIFSKLPNLKFNYWCRATQKKYGPEGLNEGMLLDVIAVTPEYNHNHYSSLVKLIDYNNFSFNAALSEITGLTSNQASGIEEGLSRNEVINFLDFWSITALAKLKKHGLTAEKLQIFLTTTPSFDHGHLHLITKLIERENQALDTALNNVHGLTHEQAINMDFDNLTRDETLQRCPSVNRPRKQRRI